MINLQGSSPAALLNVKGKWSHIDLSHERITPVPHSLPLADGPNGGVSCRLN